MTIMCAEQVAALAGHSEVVTLLLRKNCDIHAKDEDGKEAVDVARDAATLAQLNAVLHGRPSVKTLQMQEEARQADLDELAEELAEYQFVGEDGEILGVGEEDAEDLHALAVFDAQPVFFSDLTLVEFAKRDSLQE